MWYVGKFVWQTNKKCTKEHWEKWKQSINIYYYPLHLFAIKFTFYKKVWFCGLNPKTMNLSDYTVFHILGSNINLSNWKIYWGLIWSIKNLESPDFLLQSIIYATFSKIKFVFNSLFFYIFQLFDPDEHKFRRISEN